jgi:hypothetical protein
MIRIFKLQKPTELTDALVAQLTAEYIQTEKSVWKKPYIERALLESSYEKCAYCECKLNVESKYMEVEHFQHKDGYPLLVVDWDNLLPSCKRCNGTKNNHDTVIHPIVNPSRENPREHLYLRNYRFHGLTQVGEETIEVLDLNNTSKVAYPRFEISQLIAGKIEGLLDKCKDYLQNKSTRSANKVKKIVKNIMEEGHPAQAYAGTVATEIIFNPQFSEIIDILKMEHLWDEESENLWVAITSIAFTNKKKPLTA